MRSFKGWSLAGVACLMAACASPPETPWAPSALSFPVIGDIPYSDDDRQVFEEEVVPAIKVGGYPFVIHIGDYKGGGAPCTPAEDEAQLALIAQLAPTPVFYTPGDNEWTDCDRFNDAATGRPASELARLDRLRALFFSGPVSAPAAMGVKTHERVPENASWTHGGVRFATVHIVGTGNGFRAVEGDDPAEAGARARLREAAALDWIRLASDDAKNENADALVFAVHADMTDVDAGVLGKPCDGAIAEREQICDAFAALRTAVSKAAKSFDGPTLLIHGDT
ncbi:MAG: metallophosphoesterase, partial [Oricola sp.]|nr:metallophosphoesterase [Oricola sp.]